MPSGKVQTLLLLPRGAESWGRAVPATQVRPGASVNMGSKVMLLPPAIGRSLAGPVSRRRVQRLVPKDQL